MAIVVTGAAVTVAACATAAVLALASSSSSSSDEGMISPGATVASPSPVTSSQECAVCLSELSPPAAGVAESADVDAGEEPAGVLRTLPGCGHGFHAECIGRWLPLRPECPLCRRPVQLEDGVDAACGQPAARSVLASSSATAAAPAWARPARIACGFGDGRVVWTRSPSV